MTYANYAPPIAAALLLTAFFAGLPLLSRCALPRPSAAARRAGRGDVPFLLALTLAYALVAFWNLGNTRSPETFAAMEGESAVFTLPADAEPSSLMLFAGVGAGTYDIEGSTDGENYVLLTTFDQDYVAVLKWSPVSLPSPDGPVRTLRLRCTGGAPWLGEFAALDAAGTRIPLSCDVPSLCDEGDTLPASSGFMNSSYFDEIYHARTAWEHLHGVWPYEISHPPLGKEILSLGVLLFGMTPFGWRFSGTLFGVLMLPVLYLLLKRLFGGRAVPALGSVLLATDFMHFVQTRIATIDTYGVFFILLMYLFMLLWLQEDRRWALALCGLSFGLGAASKWICLYAGAGLGVLWLLHWLFRFLRREREATPGAFLKNIGFCLIFFVALPALIYYLSYLPYGRAVGAGPFTAEYLRLVLDNQRFMFSYHAHLVATHPYSSSWYHWLLNIRPILYYLEYFPDGTRSSICAFLNPVLCWGGLLSLFVLLYTAIFRRDRCALFILIGYFSQLLPWVFITRLTFAYHYFPASVFLVLSLGYVFTLFRDNREHWLRWTVPFACGSALLFVLFYPVLSGRPYDPLGFSLLPNFLQWLPTWPL